MIKSINATFRLVESLKAAPKSFSTAQRSYCYASDLERFSRLRSVTLWSTMGFSTRSKFMRHHPGPTTGFTLVEILLAIAIIAMLVVLAVSAFVAFDRDKALSGSIMIVRSALSEARSKTVSSKNDTRYGIYFDQGANAVVLFQGDAYSAGAGSNRSVELNTGVTVQEVSLSTGASSVVFERITGEAEAFGTVTLAGPQENGSATGSIQIFESGVVQ